MARCPVCLEDDGDVDFGNMCKECINSEADRRHTEDVALARRVVEACAEVAARWMRDPSTSDEPADMIRALDVEALVGRKP